ncbi:hypothetical protein E3N88_40814 [Mikania micrantha]|uniref:Uncharacterized protein n=1 Tax=Mikania micrantha TaxID=192012 RepID=A0A5N6LNT2_9ASTR|nr:hypothetical protein E3N88_40814 [Mikania micrantha]
MILTSSRYAMRKKFTFAIREGFRGFPACFVHSDTRWDFELCFALFTYKPTLANQMAQVSKIIGPWWFMRGHADGKNDDDDHGYNYAPLLASLEGNGDDDDGDYDYAPAA